MQTFPWQKMNKFSQVELKIKVLQEEIKELKGLKKQKKATKKAKDPLYGILKNTKFSDKNIKEAQQEVFNFKINK